MVSGPPDPTAVQVARTAATNASKTFLRRRGGDRRPADGGPRPALLPPPRPRAGDLLRGYVGAGKDALMAMNFVFQAGTYNGSSVAIIARHEVFTAVREMAIVGGTVVFRMAGARVRAGPHAHPRPQDRRCHCRVQPQEREQSLFFS